MAKTREIKKRIKAVGNIRRITKTMQMIATAKFAASQQRSLAGKPYTEALLELVTQLAGALGSGDADASHPLLDAGKKQDASAAKELTLVVTSERGLCGPYNAGVLRTAMGFFRSNPAAKAGVLEVVGKKGVGYFKYAGMPIAKTHALGDKPTYEQVQEVAEDFTRRFIAGEVSCVRLVAMKYISAGKQVPTVTQLLPFQTGGLAKGSQQATGPNQIFEFAPSAKELLDNLLPAAVKATLFQAINEALVSEHIARMVAMKSATDAAGKMGKLYTRKYNRARQAQITTELTEIISGAAALG
jgi:F-type H+-transporting ATPase subunit gamma